MHVEQILGAFGHKHEPMPRWLTISLVCAWAALTAVLFAWGA